MVKKQHYVPQFYLKYFTSNLKEKIWVYDKANRKIFESSICDVACQNKFYDDTSIDQYFSKVQIIERAYSEIESFFAPHYLSLINDLDSSLFALSESRKTLFANFLITQLTRTQEHRILLHQMNYSIFNQLINKGVSIEEITTLGLNQKDINDQKEHLLHIFSTEFHEMGVQILLDHMWLVYKNNTGTHFYTSDNPVNYYCSLPVESYGLSSEGIEISFPLTPNYMLVICDRRYFNKLQFLENKLHSIENKEYITFYNSLRVNSATRQIFSTTNEFNLVNELTISNPSAFFVNRKRVG